MISITDITILDLIPECLRSDPKVQAISYAFSRQQKKILALAEREKIMCNIDNLDDDVLDYLAIELRTQNYDQTYSLETKRKLIKGTLAWYAHAGTVAAVQGLCTAVFGGDAKVVEWFDQSPVGDTYTYEIQTSATYQDSMQDKFDAVVGQVQNVRSQLTKVEIVRSNTQVQYMAAVVDKVKSKYQVSLDLSAY